MARAVAIVSLIGLASQGYSPSPNPRLWHSRQGPFILRAGHSLLTALEEQLGLKLEEQRALTEILIIDRAERPSEN
jgi:hypothetical protein